MEAESKGDFFFAKYQNQQAREAYQQAYSIKQSPELLVKIAYTYNESLPSEGIEGEKLLKPLLQAKNINPVTLAKAYTYVGNQLRLRDSYDSAQVYFQKAIDLGSSRKYILPIRLMARLHINKGDLKNASKYAFWGLKEAEKHKDSLTMAWNLLDLGTIHKSLEQYDKMFLFINRLIAMEEKKEFSPALGYGYEVLGNYYMNKTLNNPQEEDYYKAISYYKKGYEADKKIHNYSQIGNHLVHLGLAHATLNQIPKAQQYYKEAETIFKQLNQPSYTASFYLSYGDFLFTSNIDKKKGLDVLNESYLLFKQQKMEANAAVACEALALGYEAIGDYKKALTYTKTYQQMNKEVGSQETKEQLQELNVKYETEKKDAQLMEQQLEILKKKQQLTQTALGASIILLIVGGLFALYRLQQRRKIKAMESEFEQTAKQLQSFNYSVSHDLRHPLINAQNSLNLLQSTPLAPDQQSYVEKVSKSVKNMNTIISGLLNLADIENSNLNITQIDTKDLIEDILQEFNTTAAVKLDNLPSIKADVRLIRQAFVNLISNAIKYTSTSPNPSIEIKGVKNAEGVIFKFSDNGVGFDSTFSNKLFKLFGRLHPQIEGIGIGLLIVKRIVEKHGGTVWAVGQKNQGATFAIQLPA